MWDQREDLSLSTFDLLDLMDKVSLHDCLLRLSWVQVVKNKSLVQGLILSPRKSIALKELPLYTWKLSHRMTDKNHVAVSTRAIVIFRPRQGNSKTLEANETSLQRREIIGCF
jgi:hypothetical protein